MSKIPSRRVLLVEDNKIDQLAFRRVFERECPHYACAFATSPAEAREKLGQGEFDVIITDYDLGAGNAFDIINLRPNAPIIFVTGHGNEEVAVQALKAGAYDYLIKDDRQNYLNILPLTIENAVRRRHAEEIARKVRFEQSIAGVFRFSTEGILQACNDAFAHIIGFASAKELVSDSGIGEHITQPELHRFILELRKERALQNYELCLKRRDGMDIHALVNVNLVQAGVGDDEFIEGTMIDLSRFRRMMEKKEKLETQLHSMQKMEALGTLAGGIAHDFNNILNAILGYTELGMKGLAANHVSAQHLREVLDCCDEAKSLVDQILAFSRREEPRREKVSLGELVRECIKMIRPSIPGTVKVVTSLDGTDDDRIVADPSQMSQVIMNLCTNAVHAMKRGGELRLALGEADVKDHEELPLAGGREFLCLSVSDTGAGIEPENLGRIFEPFYTTKPKGEGSGMGLSVAHGIIRNHGGYITVESRAGRGTEFQVFLECAEARESLRARRDDGTSGKGRGRIMVVDDDAASLHVLNRMLERQGYRVVSLHDADEARAMIKADPRAFDLLITDQMMPSMTGTELVREIRGACPDLPALVCTAYTQSISREEAAELGISEILLKPVTLSELKRAVAGAFSLPDSGVASKPV